MRQSAQRAKLCLATAALFVFLVSKHTRPQGGTKPSTNGFASCTARKYRDLLGKKLHDLLDPVLLP